MSEQLGFVGLGIMGSRMARRFVDRDADLVVWNRSEERMAPLIEAGAKPADSPAELAERCTVVMICVSDTPDVVDVAQGSEGVLAGAETGTMVIDHSTISPTVTEELAAAARKSDVPWIDAPVSGGPEGAASGTLSIMVGGSPEDVERATPIMQVTGDTITHVGPVGSGQKAKIVNQILVAINQLASSEALLFAQAAGLELEPVLQAVKGGAAGSWMLANRGPQMIVRDWSPGFTIDLQQKDLRLALEAGDDCRVPLVATALVAQFYRVLQAEGLGDEGNHALVKALERLAGIELGES